MNTTKIQLFLLCLLMAVIGYFGFVYKKTPDWKGILVKKEPIQRMIKNPEPFKYKKFFITPLADYTITGVVISTERYFFDPTSSISPIDVAIAWKKMSMPEVITEFKFNFINFYAIINSGCSMVNCFTIATSPFGPIPFATVFAMAFSEVILTIHHFTFFIAVHTYCTH